MKFTKYILVIFFLLNISASAQILECRIKEDMSLSLQLAKYKFEKLRSSNGTVYEKSGYDYKKNGTYFSAVTRLGLEIIFLFNQPKYAGGQEIFMGTTSVSFKNGMKSEQELFCYDLSLMNKERIKKGLKTSPITVLDY